LRFLLLWQLKMGKDINPFVVSQSNHERSSFDKLRTSGFVHI
jgi:hypothetical protein